MATGRNLQPIETIYLPSQRKRYCKIQSCINSAGMAPDVFGFVVPQHGYIREQWIKAISKHQTYEYNCLKYLLCYLHFDPAYMLFRNGRRSLKEGAVPTIFERTIDNGINGVLHIKEEEEFNLDDNYEFNTSYVTASASAIPKYLDLDSIQVKQEPCDEITIKEEPNDDTIKIKQEPQDPENSIQFELELIPATKPAQKSIEVICHVNVDSPMETEEEKEIIVYLESTSDEKTIKKPPRSDPRISQPAIREPNQLKVYSKPHPPLLKSSSFTQPKTKKFCKECLQLNVETMRLRLKIGKLEERLMRRDQKVREVQNETLRERRERQKLQNVLDTITGQKNIRAEDAIKILRIQTKSGMNKFFK